MTITYHGHSCFTLRGKVGTVVTDPFSNDIGLTLPNLSADLVTMSHNHGDHNNVAAVSGTARREKPFVIDHLGEYEVGGISVFGVKSFHDDVEGVERGPNAIFTIVVDGVRVCHLGDLGHELTETQINQIGNVDVLLVPVGGFYTIDAKQAVKVARAIDPYYVVPMHYKTDKHDAKKFGELTGVAEFLKEMGADEVAPVDKLKVESERLPEEMEIVVLEKS